MSDVKLRTSKHNMYFLNILTNTKTIKNGKWNAEKNTKYTFPGRIESICEANQHWLY